MFLRALVHLPREHRPALLVEIVESAKERYGTTAHNFESLGDLLVTLANSETDRKDIRAEQLDRWIGQARASEGLARLVELQKALEFARAHGLADRIDKLRYELDHIDVSTLGLRTVSVSVEIPREEMDAYIADFVSPETWQESLARFGLGGGSPPSGDLEQNLELVEELSREAPLLSIVPTIVIDASGRPIAHASDDEDKQALQLRRQEQTGIALWATTAVEILERFVAKYGAPTEEDLTAYFSGGVIPPGIAAKIAHAHVLYFTGGFDDSGPQWVGPSFADAQLLGRAVEEGMRADGTFIAINNRVSQSVPHLHVHVVPRRRGDGLRGFFWPRRKYPAKRSARRLPRTSAKRSLDYAQIPARTRTNAALVGHVGDAGAPGRRRE